MLYHMVPIIGLINRSVSAKRNGCLLSSAWTHANIGGETMDDKEKISTGPNESPRNETIAGTGSGIPDEALTPGQDLPDPPSDEEVARIAEKLGAPIGKGLPQDA